MVKIILIYGVVAAIMLAAAGARAEEPKKESPESKTKTFFEKQAAIIEPGVLPNSFWYWTDIFAEQIQYIFTISKESKGDFLIHVAEERLLEMKKLSEQGITKYAESLVSKHEEYVNKAEALYKEVKTEGWEELQKSQTELEKEILRQEAELKKQAKSAPQKYEQKQNQVFGEVGKWFKNALSHLSWKRLQIKGQKAELWE